MQLVERVSCALITNQRQRLKLDQALSDHAAEPPDHRKAALLRWSKRKGRAPVPHGGARLTSHAHDFQPSDTTMRTRRFYGGAARTMFE